MNSGSTATIGCLVGHSNECPIAVKFFKNQDEIQVDGRKYTPSSYPYGNMTYGHYLMVRNVTDADVGVYECRVFTNRSRQEQIASQEVFIEPWLTECTGIYAYALTIILYKFLILYFNFSHAVTTESDRLENWEVWLVVALLVVLLVVTLVVAIVGWAAFWRLRTVGIQKNNGEG